MFSIKQAWYIGLLGTVIVWIWEFLLHYSPSVLEINDSFEFLAAVPLQNMLIWHYFVLLWIPLYFVGYYHFYLMLAPAGEKIARLFYFIAIIAFLCWWIWIASRAFIGHIIQAWDILTPEMYSYIKNYYILFFESLLSVLRYLLFVLSAFWIYLVATGKTYYPTWMLITSPIVLLLLVFTSLAVPSIWKYMVPIALNIAHFFLFTLSLCICMKHKIS